MDRHEVSGATAEIVAEAHAADLKLSEKHRVNFLSYFFDEDTGQAFCLAKAPDRENLEALHLESHGMIPHEIISVSEDNVLLFLGKITEPTDHTVVESPFRTILFTDLEGSTSLLQAVGESAFMVLLTEARPDHPAGARCLPGPRGEAHGRWDYGLVRRQRQGYGVRGGDSGRFRGQNGIGRYTRTSSPDRDGCR